MKHVYKENGVTLRFERSGFFGMGDIIKVYKNGSFLTEFHIDDVPGAEREFWRQQHYFEFMCECWALGHWDLCYG